MLLLSIPLAPAVASVTDTLSIIALVLGFGFVVFFHELGHFLAAKAVGIRVEQFAVGFGPAIFAWRKGIGLRIGSTQAEYRKRVDQYLQRRPNAPEAPQGETDQQEIARAAATLGLGETEYRVNYVPLGGYVKMLGQDDLRPGQQSEDPKSYNRKTVGQRMIVVSAGVVMNVILAAVGFMILFIHGFNAPPSVVGMVQPHSPAQLAGIEPGDRILEINGRWMYDFTEVLLNTAMLAENEDASIRVERTMPDGSKQDLQLTLHPQRREHKGILALGIGRAVEARGPDAADIDPAEADDKLIMPEMLLLKAGDAVTQVNGKDIDAKYDAYKIEQALQSLDDAPVQLTVRDADGKLRTVPITRRFVENFSANDPVNIAGMEPRLLIEQIQPNTTGVGKLMPGDVVVAMRIMDGNSDLHRWPTLKEFIDLDEKAADKNAGITLTVLRDGKEISIDQLQPNFRHDAGLHGIGVGMGTDSQQPVITSSLEGSPAEKAGVPRGGLITEVNGQTVSNWFDVRRLLQEHGAGAAVIKIKLPDTGLIQPYTLNLSEADVQYIRDIRYTSLVAMHERNDLRKATNPLQAAKWGVVETRDFLLQFYVTIRRMIEGSIPLSSTMGPLGMFQAGSQFALKGVDWLIWFLSMISANLAVVNFLPIPVVDGGLFTFLILEKLQGKPLSPRAQVWAQMVGLALILSVFLLVTYQDLGRMLHMW